MADVTLTIGDRRHIVACRDGEEDRLRDIAAKLDARWAAANRAAGGVGGERAMLLVALMLADDLDEAEARPPEGADALLESLAERLETLADSLEN